MSGLMVWRVTEELWVVVRNYSLNRSLQVSVDLNRNLYVMVLKITVQYIISCRCKHLQMRLVVELIEPFVSQNVHNQLAKETDSSLLSHVFRTNSPEA